MEGKTADFSPSVSYSALLTFFLPIAFTMLLEPISNILLNAVIARMAEPEVSLAAFAVARSIVFVLQSPTFTLRSSTASLVAGEKSYKVMRTFSIRLTLIITGIISLLAYTNLSQWVLGDVMGVKGEVLEFSIKTLKILSIFPIVMGTRQFYQGIAILLGCQRFMPIATASRTISMAFILFLITPYVNMNGAIFGGIIFFVTSAFETGVLLWKVKASKGSIEEALVARIQDQEYRDFLNIKEAVRFALPLIMTVGFFHGIRPVVNSALARTLNPAIYLAGFEVGYSVIMIIAGPIDVLHQCSLMYWDPNDKRSLSVLKRFFLGVTLFFTAVLTIFGFTPVGEWVLVEIIKAPVNIVPTALGVVRVGFLFVLARACREYYWGILMRIRQTYLIAISRIMNIVVLVPAILLGTKFLPINPGVGACALWAIGEALEGVYIYLLSSNMFPWQTKGIPKRKS